MTTISGFMDAFRLPIAMSVVGSLVGHYVKNDTIELPRLIIEYEEKEGALSTKKPIRFLQRIFYFLLFFIGYRSKSNATHRVFFDLGFVGDLLIGIATGILARTALAMANTDNHFAVISTSLLAGYAGLSYLKAKQNEEIAGMIPVEVGERDNKPE